MAVRKKLIVEKTKLPGVLIVKPINNPTLSEKLKNLISLKEYLKSKWKY